MPDGREESCVRPKWYSVLKNTCFLSAKGLGTDYCTYTLRKNLAIRRCFSQTRVQLHCAQPLRFGALITPLVVVQSKILHRLDIYFKLRSQRGRFQTDWLWPGGRTQPPLPTSGTHHVVTHHPSTERQGVESWHSDHSKHALLTSSVQSLDTNYE